MDFTAYDDAALDVLAVEVRQEQRDRQIIRDAPGQANDLATSYWDASGREDGDPWVQPLAAFDAYPLPSTCTHNGKLWENITPANVWEPPIGWREVVTGGGLPEWVQPLGSFDAYSFGDRVKHNGHAWTCNNPGTNTTVWEPGVFGWADDGIAS